MFLDDCGTVETLQVTLHPDHVETRVGRNVTTQEISLSRAAFHDQRTSGRKPFGRDVNQPTNGVETIPAASQRNRRLEVADFGW